MKIYIVTNSNNFFGQLIYPWDSIDIQKVISILAQEYEIIHLTFESIVNSDINIQDSIVLYSSSQLIEYKEYIEDVLFYLDQKGNKLIPSLNVFKSHENKGYQELHKRILGIRSLKAKYFGHHKELDNLLEFPVVLKELDGFGSGKVSIAHSRNEIVKNTTKRNRLSYLSFYMKKMRTLLAKPVKKYILNKEIINFNYGDYFDVFKRFIVQEYKEDLKFDYKVLVINKKYYVLKRYVAQNDFRASGSGNFSFEEVDYSLLEYSRALFDKFNEPIMAFDICYSEKQYFLIEFQGTHFGPYTQIYSKGYYQIEGNQWKYKNGNFDFSEEIAQSYLNYLKING